jgi:hypothetical protein
VLDLHERLWLATAHHDSNDRSERVQRIRAARNSLTTSPKERWHHLPRPTRITLIVLAYMASLGMLILVYGVIPLGLPNAQNRDKLVWIFITNPLTYIAFSGVLATLFWAVLNERKMFLPWRFYASNAAWQYGVQASIMGVIYSQADTFTLMGLIPFVLCAATTLGFLLIVRHKIWSCGCEFYSRRLRDFSQITLAIVLYVPVLATWTIVYRNLNTVGQAIMPIGLLVLVYMWKKAILTRSDHFPLVMAMLLSGFFIENLDDVFQTIVFPVVASPRIGFVTIGVRKFLENSAYIFLFSERWFKLRVSLKDGLKRFFKRDRVSAPAIPIFNDECIDDRGHSFQWPGYLRRQCQFFMYKIISQVCSYLFFFIVTPVLRVGINEMYYPLSEETTFFFRNNNNVSVLDEENYRNAMIFTAVSLVSTISSGLFANWYIKRYYTVVYHQMRDLYSVIFSRASFLGLVIMLTMCCQLLSIAVVQYHNRIWFYDESEPPGS